MRYRFSFLILLLCSACTVVPQHDSVPERQLSEAAVKGFKNIRFWGDEAPPYISNVIKERIDDYLFAQEDFYNHHGYYPPLHYLALSGGAYDGAYAAGLLHGWTQEGTRPEFAIVTGVSTGALIAPFAFLGPEYDGKLKELFTGSDSESIFNASLGLLLDGLTGGLAITDNAPLRTRIEENITPAIMREIARKHELGFRLFVGTTNLEAQRGVIWDIGAIAASDHPKALDLIHDVILASTSVPGLFAPVFIDVEIDGQRYQEIHLDGGVTFNVFIYPLKIQREVVEAFLKNNLKRHLYIVRNSKVVPEYQQLKPRLFDVSRRSIETLTKAQGIGDLYRMYIGAKRDELDYNLSYIPDDFNEVPDELFDPVYMGKLFAVGQAQIRRPDVWLKKPPGVDYIE